MGIIGDHNGMFGCGYGMIVYKIGRMVNVLGMIGCHVVCLDNINGRMHGFEVWMDVDMVCLDCRGMFVYKIGIIEFMFGRMHRFEVWLYTCLVVWLMFGYVWNICMVCL